MSLFRSIGQKIGEDAVTDLQASGEMDWIIRSAVLDGMESAWRHAPQSPDRERAMRRIAVERGRLGIRPCRPEDRTSGWDIAFGIVLAIALMLGAVLVSFALFP
ncbi:hypothetical protein [Methylorubrum populi]|uniref:Uncharacterized protein n=1 Tax=Methylorubrum populi TaxID=223967 RepID=A0A833MZX4_9HYPH|nr:hypothetical protein [Methylorubrum populi]KAB7788082.1 hypothetical protein F8B43_0087 [Methylorubrum populi]